MFKSYDPNAIKIYVDGSANPNPGKGGIGMLIRYPDNLELLDSEFNEGYRQTTNNRMEIMACIRAFEWLQKNAKKIGITYAIVITDSEYVYNTKNNAMYWKKNGWKNKEGKPYENPDLWDSFLKELTKVSVRVSVEHEKGKTSVVLKQVDKLAKTGSANPTKEDYGYVKGKITKTTTSDKKAATLYLANAQKEIIKIYKYRVIGKGTPEQLKISFELYSSENKAFIKKFYAYTFLKLSETHRSCYVAQFNSNPKYPLIEELTPCNNPTKLAS